MQDRLGDAFEPPSVLVPGAGLGRLCHDIASLGFACEVGTIILPGAETPPRLSFIRTGAAGRRINVRKEAVNCNFILLLP